VGWVGKVGQGESVNLLIGLNYYTQVNQIDEVADINTVPNEKQQHAVTAGISNSFGFGGHNSAVIFGPYVAA
jgi:3-oxoacyl-(acyl-carrier-protein) synthase